MYLVEEGENGRDWNDVHSWNAPPGPGTNQVGRFNITNNTWELVAPPSWWSEAWGYNEWNKRWVEGTSWEYSIN